jgi:hypothetical protein
MNHSSNTFSLKSILFTIELMRVGSYELTAQTMEATSPHVAVVPRWFLVSVLLIQKFWSVLLMLKQGGKNYKFSGGHTLCSAASIRRCTF